LKEQACPADREADIEKWIVYGEYGGVAISDEMLLDVGGQVNGRSAPC
jgi:hypothetical protein